jgi:hypothetical protein
MEHLQTIQMGRLTQSQSWNEIMQDKKVTPVATIFTSEAPDENLFLHAGFYLWTTYVKNLLCDSNSWNLLPFLWETSVLC